MIGNPIHIEIPEILSSQHYLIVRAPSIDVLPILVDAFMQKGFSPTGGILIVGMHFCQAVYRPVELSLEQRRKMN